MKHAMMDHRFISLAAISRISEAWGSLINLKHSEGILKQFPQISRITMRILMKEEKTGLTQELACIDSGYQADQNGGRLPSMASFTCRDIGIDCPFEAHAITDQELMRKFIDHAESDHKMQVLSADVILRIQNAIKR
jgi:predicted small metal-binding protein